MKTLLALTSLLCTSSALAEQRPPIPAADNIPYSYCTATAEREAPPYLRPEGRPPTIHTICTEWTLYCVPTTRVMRQLPGSGVVVCHPGVLGN